MDVDQSELRALATFYNMRYRYAQTPRVLRTGFSGWHFICRGLPLTMENAWFERSLFSDDANRLGLDMASTLKPQQILFGKKDGRERWLTDERGLLALPWWVSRHVRKTGQK